MGQSAQDFEFTVLTGLNAGVTLSVPAGRHSIGGSENDGIRLDGVTETLANFIVKKGSIKLKPIAGAVEARPGGSVAAGQIAEFKLPARFALTPEIEIFADRAPAAVKKRTLVKPLLVCAGVLATALVLSAFQIDFRLNSTQATQTEPALVATIDPTTASTPQETVLAQSPIACADCAQQAAESLRADIASVDLTGLIVKVSGGALRIEGALSEADRSVWSDIRRGFDSRWPMVPILTSLSETKDGAPFAIATLWLGEPRQVKTMADETYEIGDETPDGWTVSAIEESFVELSQPDMTIRISY